MTVGLAGASGWRTTWSLEPPCPPAGCIHPCNIKQILRSGDALSVLTFRKYAKKILRIVAFIQFYEMTN